jgi:phosphopantothenate-cysteine ligase/phosphopantothenoylcysteine decarboxylase/phosphopantothenate--cysteine ligase
MRLLVTAGNTESPIDAVRCITNVFSGQTGAHIAALAAQYHWPTHLLTSRPESVPAPASSKLQVTVYRTFDELAQLMEHEISRGNYDGIVHSAAVSDYLVDGVFDSTEDLSHPIDVSQKISSKHSSLWIRLKPAPKLVDRIRTPWGFRGVLVKFKLEMGISETELLRRGVLARKESNADLLVANLLESRTQCAYLIDQTNSAYRIERANLARELLDRMEVLHQRKISEWSR